MFAHDCFVFPGINLLRSFITDGKRFNPVHRVVHVKDLNFVLRSKTFVHTNRQLQASHLILRCTLEYKTWQPFSQALSVDNPLLSYIDVWHANFLCPSLTTGEAQDLNLRCTTAEDLAPIKDELAERVSWAFREQEHIPVEGNVGQAQAAEQEVVEVEQEVEMVTRRMLTANRYLSSS